MKSTDIQGTDVKHPIVKSLIESILNSPSRKKTPSENWRPNKPSLTLCSLPDCGKV